ncbi:hypothetical protein Taro_013624 [Colocasia esculenta]|uniref:protein-ribulosamine 3-kinase n=1 Tax=Colocasia esculenta TaxID=4460 RepID=A0A843UGN3_COLES|nr:hypothetical protein [Colocasia esculenta]
MDGFSTCLIARQPGWTLRSSPDFENRASEVLPNRFSRSIGPSMFEGESLGLNLMYETKTIRVPQPFKSILGKKLAEMHKAGKSYKGFGQQLIKNMRPLFEGAVLEPCLLHGDLWSGNISSDKNGEPVILDPACYWKRLHNLHRRLESSASQETTVIDFQRNICFGAFNMDIMKQNLGCPGVLDLEAPFTVLTLRY